MMLLGDSDENKFKFRFNLSDSFLLIPDDVFVSVNYVDMSICCSLIRYMSERDLDNVSEDLWSGSLTSPAVKVLGGSCGGRSGHSGETQKNIFNQFWLMLPLFGRRAMFDLVPPRPPPPSGLSAAGW